MSEAAVSMWKGKLQAEGMRGQGCHGLVQKRLKNLNLDNARQIRSPLHSELAKLRQQPHLLLGFFHRAGLALKQLW